MYDPLVDEKTPSSQPFTESYWKSISQSPPSLASLNCDTSTEVLIIGAGLTGMSCAWHCQQQSIEAMVIDANQPGWGCSGRNAGFILPGSGRLDFSGLRAAWGNDIAGSTLSHYYQALDTIEELRQATGNNCDLTEGGYLKIGHSQKAFEQLCAGMKSLPNDLQGQYQIFTESEIKDVIPDYPSFGGVYRSRGQGLNPLKLSHALQSLLESSRVKIYGDTPALEISKSNQQFKVTTPTGNILAQHLVICSNAYSLPGLYQPVTEKQFPVLSSVLVTEPLPESTAVQWQAGLMAMDTRSLKYYFRLLPDNRLLFGGRGAITGKAANTDASQRLLKQAFDSYFPSLNNLKAEYFWSGWVSVSADNIPHTTKVEEENIYYATGFCGSGLSFSCHAGKLLAQKVTGQYQSDCAFDRPIPAFPFVPFRRVGLYLYYQWHRFWE